jgi:hypothetical protein
LTLLALEGDTQRHVDRLQHSQSLVVAHFLLRRGRWSILLV